MAAVSSLVGYPRQNEPEPSKRRPELLMSRPLETTSDAILQAVNDAIISFDIEGVIVTWNRGAEVLYGYTASESIGSPVDIIMPPEIAPTLRRESRMPNPDDSAGLLTPRG